MSDNNLRGDVPDYKFNRREKGLENDELIIEENTIYEIDLECYECLKKARKNQISITEKRK